MFRLQAKQLNRDIEDFLFERLRKFMEDTGITPSQILVNMVRTSTIDDPNRHTVSNVSTRFDV